jgi:Protein of unknown function (DUF1552)
MEIRVMRSQPARDQVAGERVASLSRRGFLRGVGACVALPSLPSLLPQWARAAEAAATKAAVEVAGQAPRRMAFVAIPNGVNLDQFWPKGEGRNFQLASTMEPLAGLKDQIQVIAGLDQVNATPGRDGPGDHARANASLLTGCRARKTAGADIHVGPSIDQIAAQHVGHLTRFPSLELTCDTERRSGNCDSGYACAYEYNVSWRTANTPMPPESNPRLVFERLFGTGKTPEERRRNVEMRKQTRRSILDFVRDDARSLGQRLSANDADKLDEYLTSVREVEQRILKFGQAVREPNPDFDVPDKASEHHEERMQVMYDLLALAFQTDSTRIATLMIAHEGSNRPYKEIGITRGHHDLSHHGGKAENLEMIAQIDKHHMSYFARFLEKLGKMRDTDGQSILHNSMIVYCSGNGDGNAHSHTNLPVLMAGAGGGKLRTGRFLKVDSLPMSNMFLEMLAHLDIEGVTQFGDSNEKSVSI